MKADHAQPTAMETNGFNGKLDFHNEEFISPLPSPKLYWLTGRRYYHIIKKVALAELGARTHRDRDLVSSIYEAEYALDNEAYARSRDARRDVFLVNNRPVHTNGWYIIKNHSDMLERAFAPPDLSSVLEVGSGRGKNMALLALRRPNLTLTGLELTKHGVQQGRVLVQRLPQQFLKLAGCETISKEQREALGRVRFHQGSALDMPFEDKSFDCSYTCLVLEQMPQHYREALREMRRVTRKYCVFIEAFTEANHSLGAAYLRSVDYFRYSYQSFAECGLEPVYFTDDMPQKLTFKTGLLIAKVRN